MIKSKFKYIRNIYLYSAKISTSERNEAHVETFVEGLGPGQLVGRQVLGMPCLGEIQLSFIDRKGHLEIEVIRARNLVPKNSGKLLPQPYVKVHLLEEKMSIEKQRTPISSRKTLDPLYQHQIFFSNSYKHKILQVNIYSINLNNYINLNINKINKFHNFRFLFIGQMI